MNNFKDFRVAFLHSKFWTHNSLLVPNTKVILNEDFVDWHNLLRVPAQIQHFKVFWFAKGVSGEICIPGQWNYAYIDGKFYHLVKMHSNGFVKGVEEEWFYYNVIYDDWQNDWMNNTFYLKGTLELTGDPQLAMEHIHQMSPIIQNVNGFRFLNGIERGNVEENTTVISLPKDVPLSMELRGMSSADRIAINTELEAFHARGELKPREDELWIPFMYKIGKGGNWKWNVLQNMKRYEQEGIKVFDVTVQSVSDAGQAGKFRNILENMLGSNELYLASNNENRVYSFAKSINPTKWVAEIDLTGCTDITVLDRLKLTPLYTIDNPAPKFSVRRFVDQVCSRQGWPSDYKDEMIELFEDLVAPAFAPLINYDDDYSKKIFRNVGIEKIERDVVSEADVRGAVKNPEGIKGADTRLVSGGFHKNHMWDNGNERVTSVRGCNINLSEKQPDEINALSKAYRKGIHNRGSHADGFLTNNVYISPLNALVYLPDEYKLVSKENNEDYLDFSKNANELYDGFALLPDYGRQTHTLGRSGPYMPSDYYLTGVYLDPKNPAYVDRTMYGRTMNLLPIVINEIVEEKVRDVHLDGEKPTDEILKAYLDLGKDYEHSNKKEDGEKRDRQSTFRAGGAAGLSQGAPFYALSTLQQYSEVFNNDPRNNLMYQVKHKTYSAKCYQGGCDYILGLGEEHTIYTSIHASASLPECVYESEERKGRRFHTEYSFPVKTDQTYSIIDILREYDDIPDNFLRGEVINTGIKKGYIAKTMRTIEKTASGRLNASRITTEEEKQIPKNTIVMIGICSRPSGSPQGDKDFDQAAINEYKKKYPNRMLGHRLYQLKNTLYNRFFKDKGETGSTKGAIPVRFRNETSVNRSQYPKSGGQSQMSLSYGKPHQGHGYMCGTRFVPPKITTDVRGRFNSSGYLDFNYQNTDDGLISVIPMDYANSNEWQPKFTYRKKATSNLDSESNLILGLLTQHITIYPLDSIYRKHGGYSGEPIDIAYGSNTRKAEGGTNADYLFDRFRKYFYNGNTLTLNDFFNNAKTYKTARLDNPKKIPIRGKSSVVGTVSEFTPLDEEIPPFMAIYLDLEKVECALHTWERNDKITSKQDRIQLYKEKLNELTRSTLQFMEAWNVGLKFEGTNGYASIKLNNKGQYPRWDYEFFTNEVANFRHREEKKWNFVNHKEKDVDVLINTRNELSIYGNKFPLKSRKFVDGDELDVGLMVKPLDDVKQTEAAAWYSVQMNLNEQDILQTFIETPKELTKYAGFSAYEREKMIREIGFRGEEYLYNMQMLEYQKEENKFTNQYEKDWIYKEWKYDVARGATQIVGGVLDVATGGMGMYSAAANMATEMTIPHRPSGYEMTKEGGVSGVYGDGTEAGLVPVTGGTMRGRFNYPTERDSRYYRNRYLNNVGDNVRRQNLNMIHRGSRSAGRAMGGLGGIVGGALTIAEAYETFNIKDEYRKQKYAMAEKKLSAEGDILNKRHEFERKNLLDDLWAMSANVHYPQLNANIVYKLYNKHIGIGDIHMVQYYPKGKLLDYIKEYYKEFGYNIMVRNFECTGIQDIKNHLRYQFIYEINHPNICIQEMVRARALAGIKVVPWVQ